MAAEFKGFARNQILHIEKRKSEFLAFTGGYKPEAYEIEYIEVEGSILHGIISAIPPDIAIPLIGDLDKFVNDVRFYMVILTDDHERAIFFRKFTRNRELLRSKYLIVQQIGDKYCRLETPLFQFDQTFDAIYFKGILLSLNKTNFQHIFRYYDLLAKVAEQSLNEIQAKVPIANFDDFAASCRSHPQKLGKLSEILKKPYLASITMKDIKKVIKQFEMPVEIIKENNEEKIVFQKKQPWIILHLLDDAYLGSVMTGIKYEVNSKKEYSL
ncbi:MAG: DUF4868 domain-containing protein [Synechococcaceae cyanobacterium SM2_3_1]|nr:DUF4868 domain-containing protein [Synechococcaceae cyanobacterium SM2_3_1]